MSAEQNMALARRLMEARVKGDVDAVDEMLAPNFVSHARLLPDQAPDREGAKWAVAQLAAAFSEASVLVEDQVAQGDKVVTRFVVHSTHDLGEHSFTATGWLRPTTLQVRCLAFRVCAHSSPRTLRRCR